MYIKISATNKTFTFCKLIFHESNKNNIDFGWVHNKIYGYSYKLCMCADVYCCKNKLIKNAQAHIQAQAQAQAQALI